MVTVGQTATRTLTLTESHVAKFAELSGDYKTVTRTDGAVVLDGEAWCYTFSPESTAPAPA